MTFAIKKVGKSKYLRRTNPRNSAGPRWNGVRGKSSHSITIDIRSSFNCLSEGYKATDPSERAYISSISVDDVLKILSKVPEGKMPPSITLEKADMMSLILEVKEPRKIDAHIVITH